MFKNKYNLQVHIEAVHQGRKDYKCNVCRKLISHKGNMEAHVRLVHDGEKPFECDRCEHRPITIKRFFSPEMVNFSPVVVDVIKLFWRISKFPLD